MKRWPKDILLRCAELPPDPKRACPMCGQHGRVVYVEVDRRVYCKVCGHEYEEIPDE